MIWISIYLAIGLGFAVANIEDSIAGFSDFSPRKTFFLFWLGWPYMGLRNAWKKSDGNILEFIHIVFWSCLVVVFLGWAIIGIPFVWLLSGGPLELRKQLKRELR